MGGSNSRLSFFKKEITIVMIGLDGSGKTSILNRLLTPRVLSLPQTTSTIGFNIETISLPFAKITLWDGGGQAKIRPMWRKYYHNGHAFIFVVSALESGRLLEAREELHMMCKDRDIWDCPLLVLVNKSERMEDQRPNPDVTPPEFVAAALDIASSGFRRWEILAVSALSGEGLDVGLKWLVENASPSRR